MLDDPVLVNDWHVVARSEDVGDGGVVGVRLLGDDLVVWRQNGAVMARVGDSAYAATEAHGLIWATLGRPDTAPPPYHEWDDPDFRHVLGGPYTIGASAPRVIENFLDATHFPFVHEGILGDRDHTEVGDYNVETTPDGVTARDLNTWTPNPDGSGEAKMAQWLYRVLRPLTAYIGLSVPGGGPERYTMYFAVTPVDEHNSVGWMWNSMNYNHDMSDEEFEAYIDEIVLQDIPIVESQRPELLPLDLQAELHLRADKTAVAYRRWLRELGLTFGTA